MSLLRLSLLRASGVLVRSISPPPISLSRTLVCCPRHLHETETSPGDDIRAATAFLEPCEDRERLRQVHARLTRLGALRSSSSSSSSAFHWNCVMRAYLRLALPFPALSAFAHMLHSGVAPDSYTMPIALKAASHLFALDLGRQLHGAAAKRGLQLDEYCESGIICVYAKTGDFSSARKMFVQNRLRKLGSWNAIISGLAQGGRAAEAIDCFVELRRRGLIPDDVTMVSVASACGSLGGLQLAQQVHKCVLQARAREEGCTLVQLQNSLVDMYGKCGRTDLAHRVFASMRHRNVSTWTAMIMGLAMHGHACEAVSLFRQMGVPPNGVTFVSVLSACAHGGMVEEGMQFFRQMKTEYRLEPTVAHYGCIVDMLGRVGRLEEARGVVEEMPMRPNSVILGTLLGACEKHGNVEVGEWVAGKLAELEPGNDGVYVVLSNICASKGLWKDVERLRHLMKEKSMAKLPAYSLATRPA